MANAKVKHNPPGIHLALVPDTGAGEFIPPRFPSRSLEIESNQWVHAVCTPTATKSSFDPCNETQSQAGAEVAKNLDGQTGIAQSFYFAVGARAIDNAALPLVENVIVVKLGAAEVARITVDATQQTIGEHVWHASDGVVGDAALRVNTTIANITAGAIEADDEVYTKVAHGLVTGQRVVLTSFTGGTGLTAGTTWYFHRLSADTGYLCATRALAEAGTPGTACTVDATSVVLTPNEDVWIDLTTVDPNLEIHFLLIGTD